MSQDNVKFDATKEERALVKTVVDRAVEINPRLDRLSTTMDLLAAHANGNPMDFAKLATVETFTLMHDVYGIARHLDRETGKLGDFFSPRCSLKADA